MAEWTLSSILSEIGSAVDGLIELADRKTDAIVNGDIERLNEVTAQEEQISRALAALEEERLRLMGSADQEDAEVEGLRRLLRDKVSKLKLLNERNQELLKQALRIVEFELKLFMPQMAYGGAPAKGPVVFDHKV